MDGQTLYYPGDKEAVLTNPTLNLQTGYAGTFEFSVPPNNPLYDKIKNRSSMVSVFRDTTEIFYGEVRKQPKIDRYRNKNVYCAGAMSFLADSIQPQVPPLEPHPPALARASQPRSAPPVRLPKVLGTAGPPPCRKVARSPHARSRASLEANA